MIKNNNDEAIEIDENNKKLKNFQSRDQDSKLTENFENLRINQLIEQIEIVLAISASLNQTNQSFKNIFCSNYVKLNNFEYKSRNRDDRDCDTNAIKKIIEILAQIDRARDFAVKIKKNKNSKCIQNFRHMRQNSQTF